MQNQKNNLRELREWRENVHKLLHINLNLLSLRKPMNPEFAERFVEGMFKKPNSQTFNLCAFYLISVIDKKYITSDLSLFMTEPKMISRFRREFVNFIHETMKIHKGYISPIIPSWLVTAGGFKAAKLMFELSQVALKVSIENKFGNQSLDTDSLHTTVCTDIIGKLETEVATKTDQLSKYSENIKNTADTYRTQIELTEINTEDKMNLLKKYVQNVKNRVGKECPDLNGLLDVKTPSPLLEEWDATIEARISNVEKRWSESSASLIETAKTCKNTCEEVLRRYTKQSPEETLLEYNPICDKFGSYRNEIIKDNILHFPSLFKVYNSIIYQNFATLLHLKFDSKYCDAIEKKLHALNIKYSEANQLVETINDLHSKLTIKEDLISFDCNISETDQWIIDALNIPILNV